MKMDDKSSIAPTTTAEQNLVTAGQRRVNLIWEFTQSAIALVVTGATVYSCVTLALRTAADEHTVAAFLLLSNAFFLVVGFYFGRTNHQRVGGIRAPAPGEYEGR